MASKSRLLSESVKDLTTNISKIQEWTLHEIEIIEKFYPIETAKELLKRLPGRTIGGIRWISGQLKVKKLNEWTDIEDSILRKFYNKEPITNVQKKLANRSLSSISHRA